MIGLKEMFGANFKSLRELKGYTQDKVSEGSDLSLSYLSLVEQGRANPTLTTIEKLAKGLDVEFADILNFAHSQSSPAEIRDRLVKLVLEADDKTLLGAHSAVVTAFRP